MGWLSILPTLSFSASRFYPFSRCAYKICSSKQYGLGTPGWLSWLSIQALDFGSGHDLMVRGIEPHVRIWADSAEPAWDSLSPSLSAPPPLMLSLSQNKKLENFLNKIKSLKK